MHGHGRRASDETESIATIREALERGVNVIDTGDFYGMGKNELLVGQEQMAVLDSER